MLADIEATGPHKHLEHVQVTSEGLPPVKNFSDGRGYPHFYKQVYLAGRWGVPNNKVEPVSQSFLHVLMRKAKLNPRGRSRRLRRRETSYRRTALARWLTDTDSEQANCWLVIVNRLWQHHLGAGIVATPNDFGRQGEPPSNPQLLDWLANDLIDHGWQLKRLHKLIMTSSVYMQGDEIRPENVAIDPHNVFLCAGSRIEAEPIRDSMLSAAGLLDTTMYGPGTLDESMRRRSIYFTVKRSG